jgi:hypothetical protein
LGANLLLGSHDLAGNSFLADRKYITRQEEKGKNITKELHMVGGVCPNSMDAVVSWGQTRAGKEEGVARE